MPPGRQLGDLAGPEIRRKRGRVKTVWQGRSALSGRIRVVDVGQERRLVAGGETLSAWPLDGDWAAARREYWGRALEVVPLPPRPRALFVGLGGGTQVHLLHQAVHPRRVTIVERDPVILRLALRWFGLGELGGLEFFPADAARALAALALAHRRFDFVMEDAAYAADPEGALPLALALVPLVAPGGALVVNRHRRSEADRLARALAPAFTHVRLVGVRREAENVLVACRGRRRQTRRRL